MDHAPEGLQFPDLFLSSDLFSDRALNENDRALKGKKIVKNAVNQEGKCLFYGAASATDPAGKLAMIPPQNHRIW